jgi:hypothetical protein
MAVLVVPGMGVVMSGEAVRLDWNVLSPEESEWQVVRAALRKRIRAANPELQPVDVDDLTQDAAVLMLQHWNARRWRELRDSGQDTTGLQIVVAARHAVAAGIGCSIVSDYADSPTYLTDERTAKNLKSIESHMPRGVARRN